MAQYLDLDGLKTLWNAIGTADTGILNAAKDSFKDTLENDLTFRRALVPGSETEYRLELVLDAGSEAEKVVASFNDSAYVKDGILKDVTIIDASDAEKYPEGVIYNGEPYTTGKFIEFTWNTDAGTANDYLKVDEIGKTYSASDSIAISSDNKLSVTKVGDDITKTSAAINIVGGPLAAELGKAFGTEIPANTSLQDILMKLACAELLPNPAATSSYGSLTLSLATPAVTAPSWNNKLYEVGSVVTLPGSTGNSVTSSTPALTFDNFAYGYSTTEGKFNAETAERNPSSVTATVTEITDGVVYTFKRNISKFTTAEGTVNTVSGAVGADLSFADTSATVVLGDNTINYSLEVNKATYSATVKAESVYYAKTNLGNTTLVNSDNSTSQQKVDKTTLHTYTATAPAKRTTTSYKATGVWPVYNNISSGAFVETAANRLDLTTGNQFVIEAPTEIGSAYVFTFEYPAKKTISKFEAKDAGGNWATVDASTYSKEVACKRTVQNVQYDYYRLQTTGGNGKMSYRITLSGNLNA